MRAGPSRVRASRRGASRSRPPAERATFRVKIRYARAGRPQKRCSDRLPHFLMLKRIMTTEATPVSAALAPQECANLLWAAATFERAGPTPSRVRDHYVGATSPSELFGSLFSVAQTVRESIPPQPNAKETFFSVVDMANLMCFVGTRRFAF